MKCYNLLMLIMVLFLTPIAFAQVPPCPCDTQVLSGGITGNDIVESLCPNGQLIEGASSQQSAVSVFIESDTFLYGAASSPMGSICRITEFNVDGIDLPISDQEAAFCRASLVERCGLNINPIPTLSEWGMIMAAVGLGLVGAFFALKRRKSHQSI